MSQAEFQKWQLLYGEMPFDDLHRVYRPAALIAAATGGGKVSEMMDFLVPPLTEPEPVDGYTEIDMSVFAALGVKPPKRE